VSCIGISDDRGDGVFDRSVSLWGNDFSNMTALFGLADGGTMRTNEFRRVGYWNGHESRFRFYGTEQVFEQSGHGATLSVKTEGEDYAKGETRDISDLFFTQGGQVPEGFGDIDPALMQSFASGTAPVQDRSRLPKEFEGAHNGHEGAHHFLADDFVYYLYHRTHHEIRVLWASHVVHHSSERYNLSTALRQPVAEGVTLTVPFGVLGLLGVRPALIEHARGINLIYQFWIHTETIRRLGRLEKVLNTPSHHRVHHGSNRQYLDRNHGSILILWDRLFGTFEEEDERVVYGLTRNIDTYNPLRIASHEWRDIARDVADADTWSDRFSFLLRGPGWAYSRRPSPVRAA